MLEPRRLWLALGCVWLALLGWVWAGESFQQPPPAPAPAAAVEEELLGEVDAAAQWTDTWVSPARPYVVSRVKRKDDWLMVVDGVEWPAHQEVGTPLFSPDRQRIAYAAKRLKKWLLVVDAKEGPDFDELGAVHFSPDGQQLVYAGKRGPVWVMVVDGTEGPRFAKVGAFVRSPDGKRWAYVGKKDPTWVMVAEGQPGPAYEEIEEVGELRFGIYSGIYHAPPIFSPDSQQLAYRARRGKNWMVVVNALEGSGYQELGAPVFSPDSKHLAYPAKRAKKWLLVFDGVEGPAFDEVGQPRFSPDSQHWAYAAKKGPSWRVVVDGQEQPLLFQKLANIVFSPDSQHLAYLGKQTVKWVVVVDGKEESRYDDLTPLAFSPDSQHWAYAAKKLKKWQLVLDGKEQEAQFDELAALLFSPDNQRLAYVVRRGSNWVILVDAKEGPGFELVGGLAFSADSRRVAYAGANDTGTMKQRFKGSAVIDGEVGPEFEGAVYNTFWKDLGRAAAAGGLSAVGTSMAGSPVGPIAVTGLQAQQAGQSLLQSGPRMQLGSVAGTHYETHGVSAPVFSPDARRVAYLARASDTETFVFLDGQPGPTFVDILTEPLFSADGRRLAYLAAKADPKELQATGPKLPQKKDLKTVRQVVVVDAQEGKAYDFVWPRTLHFSGENSVRYLARAGRKIYRVTQPAP